MITKSQILSYLQEKFHGIGLSKSDIQLRYDNYVKFAFATTSVEKINPYLHKESSVLDIGSGFGSFVYLLRQKKINAYGLEITDFLVKYSRERLIELSLKEPSSSIYLKGTALKLPFSNNSFDVITMWNVLEHIQDHKTALKEAFRVLKPNGKLFIDNVNYSWCFIEPHYRVTWLPFLPKKLGIAYLKLRNLNPNYMKNGIFLVSKFSILRVLYKSNAHISTSLIEKLKAKNPIILSPFKKRLWNFLHQLCLIPLVVTVLKVLAWNPLSKYTSIIVTKK